MKISRSFTITLVAMTLLLLIGSGMNISAQGRGRGGGGGNPNPGHIGGPPSGSPGGGRSLPSVSNTGRGSSASNRDPNRADRSKNVPSDNELNKFRGISRKLGTTPQALSKQYQLALLNDPNLKFGQFVAANVVADNLNGRYPNVTTAAILAGLSNGKSIGQTLHDLRVNPDIARSAEKQAKQQIKDSQRGM